jgi:hypothetical protein
VDACEAELDDEAVLQGAPEPFDAAFGLRRAGRDVADAEVVKDAAELGRMLGALPDAEVRALRVGELPRHGQLDQPRPRHFLPAHLDGLPSFHGVTFS